MDVGLIVNQPEQSGGILNMIIGGPNYNVPATKFRSPLMSKFKSAKKRQKNVKKLSDHFFHLPSNLILKFLCPNQVEKWANFGVGQK